MTSNELKSREQTEIRMTVLLGIIRQLITTRQNRLFTDLGLTLSQFGVLNHFVHDSKRSWTISDLAKVMEMNQPGITKIVSVLIDKGLLQSKLDEIDKRKRHLTVTTKGLKFCEETYKALLPDVSHMFEEWNDSSLQQFRQHLEKLMLWLDNNRER